MKGQISIFDWMPSSAPEPNIGDYVKRPGAIICHIMRAGYIGRKILVDVSTEHNELYQCGILENYIPYESFMRSIVYVGDRQRKLLHIIQALKYSNVCRGITKRG